MSIRLYRFTGFMGIGMALAMMLVSLPVQSRAASGHLLGKQRETFLEAREAVMNKRYRTYKKLSQSLKGYPLYGYLEYEYLRRRLYMARPQEVQDFIQTYNDSPISERMLAAWLYVLAAKGEWSTYHDNYRDLDSAPLQCNYLRSRVRGGERGEQVMKDIAAMWTVGESQASQCDPLFAWWQKKGGLTPELAWKRITLAMEKGRVNLAKYLKRHLSREDQRLVDTWVKVHYRPDRYLDDRILDHDTEKTRAVLLHGIRRLARRDLFAAYEKWQQLRMRYRYEQAERIELDRYLALKAAWQHRPEAVDWLGEVMANDEDVSVWRVRSALLQKNWSTALLWLDKLPPELAKNSQWTYWRARVLQEIGIKRSDAAATNLARQLFNSLTEKRNFFGFLASDNLGQPYSIETDSIAYDERELAVLVEHPILVRAYELFKIGMIVDARREWMSMTRTLNERQLQLAAILANRWGWHDRAIMTVALTDHDSDLDIRFPTVYQDLVTESAQSVSIDPAWVYGVVRQESAFMTDAKSSAGAMGLMQLMPKTARLTARMLNTSIKSKFELLDAKKNIMLGSAYLKHVLDMNNGHQILATASYNAGPHRVKQWIPEQELPADIWAETIPFTETRKYVRRVMAYTTIFDQRLDGEHKSISERMPVIIPDATTLTIPE